MSEEKNAVLTEESYIEKTDSSADERTAAALYSANLSR